MNYPTFPRDFVFGAATASYQVEGAVSEGNRGESIWDEFCRRADAIKGADTGEVTCDHYHRYRQDVAVMRELGLQAYRFSLAWPRVIPDGEGPVNPLGLDFYSRLVDELLGAGIRPFATLFHWDLPLELQRRYGGFSDRRCIDAYLRYVEEAVTVLGDRVKDWITFNEPWVYAVLGHLLGVHAPGLRKPRVAFRVAHHQLVAHGRAVDRIRAICPGARVGITLNLAPVYGVDDSSVTARAVEMADQSLNRFFLDALFRGRYPERFWRCLSFLRPPVHPGDMETIATPIDLLGVNNYTRHVARRSYRHPPFFFDMDGANPPEREYFGPDGREYTAMGWEVYPQGLYELLMRVKNEYGNVPVYITENGAAFTDEISGGDVADSSGAGPAGARVEDPRRVAYLNAYLRSAHQAVVEGCDLRGYFVWSFTDNFEWAQGYSKRFGIVYLDYPTQRRIVKASGRWYAGVIAASRG
jgi:beta-glucosidase